MGRFSSLFSAALQHNKSKKVLQAGNATQQSTVTGTSSQYKTESKANNVSAASNAKTVETENSTDGARQNDGPSLEECCMSDELNSNPADKESLQSMHLKRSFSAGNMLDKVGSREFSDKKEELSRSPSVKSGYQNDENGGDSSSGTPNQECHSTEALKNFAEGKGDGLSADNMTDIRAPFARSQSAVFITDTGSNAPENAKNVKLIETRSFSFDFRSPVIRMSHSPNMDGKGCAADGGEEKAGPYTDELLYYERWNLRCHDGYSSRAVLPDHDNVHHADSELKGEKTEADYENDTIVYDLVGVNQETDQNEVSTGPVDLELGSTEHPHESSDADSGTLTPRAFNMKRIADWIDQIDVGTEVIISEDQAESSSSASRREPDLAASGTHVHRSVKSPSGIEMAYSHISTLNPGSSSAQLANLGLVAIPVLNAFSGLRAVNLSGNSFVRITTGALPKGLHMLDLSRNGITIIEGLKELTRLRVLDLSYNRISRIGHGLAACSSLKELYLAGNKISEIDGLHRLLKLKLLDLRNNKLSNQKGLGQLAANYNSLEAIYLDGNPAQTNVGDEQLKKYLLSLLPHLVYYNRHLVRATGTKESGRLVSSHRASNSGRTNHKSARQSRPGRTLSTSQWKSSKAPRATPLPSTVMQPIELADSGKDSLARDDASHPLRRIQSEGKL